MEYIFQQETDTKYLLQMQDENNIVFFRFNTNQEIEHPDENPQDKIISAQQHQVIINSFSNQEKIGEFATMVWNNPNTGFMEYLNSI